MLVRRTRHDNLPAQPLATSRRGFLRRAGVTAALTAAVAGGAELAGLSAASAGTRKSSTSKPETCCRHCVYTPRQCNGGNPCAGGYCCFHCTPTSGSCLPVSYDQCIPNRCATFSQCGTGF